MLRACSTFPRKCCTGCYATHAAFFEPVQSFPEQLQLHVRSLSRPIPHPSYVFNKHYHFHSSSLGISRYLQHENVILIEKRDHFKSRLASPGFWHLRTIVDVNSVIGWHHNKEIRQSIAKPEVQGWQVSIWTRPGRPMLVLRRLLSWHWFAIYLKSALNYSRLKKYSRNFYSKSATSRMVQRAPLTIRHRLTCNTHTSRLQTWNA
jgi:hypothetical protein